jgi:hypothetical protein
MAADVARTTTRSAVCPPPALVAVDSPWSNAAFVAKYGTNPPARRNGCYKCRIVPRATTLRRPASPSGSSSGGKGPLLAIGSRPNIPRHDQLNGEPSSRTSSDGGVGRQGRLRLRQRAPVSAGAVGADRSNRASVMSCRPCMLREWRTCGAVCAPSQWHRWL